MSAELSIAAVALVEKAKEIIALIAGDSFPSYEDAHSRDWCGLCGKTIPYGVTGTRQVGTKCRACGDTGHYEVGSLCFCSEERVPNMVETKGVLQDPSLHEEKCPWRMAKEWMVEQERVTAAYEKLNQALERSR